MGIVSAIVIAVLAVGGLDGESSASSGSAWEPTYVVYTSDAIADLFIEDEAVTGEVKFIRVSSAEDVRRTVIEQDADGVVVDPTTLSDLPPDVLPFLYANGRVVTTFNMQAPDALRLAKSSQAFPGVDERFVPDVTRNPGRPLGPTRSHTSRSSTAHVRHSPGKLAVARRPESTRLVCSPSCWSDVPRERVAFIRHPRVIP